MQITDDTQANVTTSLWPNRFYDRPSYTYRALYAVMILLYRTKRFDISTRPVKRGPQRGDLESRCDVDRIKTKKRDTYIMRNVRRKQRHFVTRKL